MASIQVLLDSQQGPLPIKGQFQPLGDQPPSIYLSGTAKASVPATTCQVQLSVYGPDGQDAGYTTAAVFSNEANQHKTLLALLVNQKPLAFGVTYTFNIMPVTPTTISDETDFYSVTIVY